MIPLSIIADTTGGWVALIFVVVFLAKAILALIGAGSDFDADVDVDGDVDIEVGDTGGGFGISTSDVFSLKGFLNFGVGFSLSWALFGIDNFWHVLLAVGVGVFTWIALIYVYRACMKLEGKLVTEDPKSLVGRMASVYFVGPNYITIQVTLNGRITELTTLPDSEFNYSDFKTGDSVFISSVKEEAGFIKFYVKKF